MPRVLWHWAGGLAIAVLAVIAVLPEYAVDLYFADTAGHNPDYIAYAAANMTGSHRLLLGLGWSLVVLVSLAIAKRRTGKSARELTLESGYRVALGLLDSKRRCGRGTDPVLGPCPAAWAGCVS